MEGFYLYEELYLNQKQTQETVEGFYHCTSIPIKFYASNHHPIAAYGYSDEYECLIEEYKIYKGLITKFINNTVTSSFETIYVEDNICFTGIPSCPKILDQGIYIIGPYHEEEVSDSVIPYKPKKYIPNLIMLLHGIAKSCEIVDSHLSSRNTAYSLYVKKGIDFMYDNYQNPITLDDISKHVKINKCYFCSLFKKEVNKTISQFLNEIRIDKSKELLVKRDMSILDVALNVGFNNQNYYNMTFKKLTGSTPMEFKRSSIGV